MRYCIFPRNIFLLVAFYFLLKFHSSESLRSGGGSRVKCKALMENPVELSRKSVPHSFSLHIYCNIHTHRMYNCNGLTSRNDLYREFDRRGYGRLPACLDVKSAQRYAISRHASSGTSLVQARYALQIRRKRFQRTFSVNREWPFRRASVCVSRMNAIK